MRKQAYVPDRGDIIWTDFDPQAGREQAGRRPALVLSPQVYQKAAGLMICVPITSKAKGYPFEVPIAGKKVVGVALADHVKNLDWRARGGLHRTCRACGSRRGAGFRAEVDRVVTAAGTGEGSTSTPHRGCAARLDIPRQRPTSSAMSALLERLREQARQLSGDILHGTAITVVAVAHQRQRPHYGRERVADRRWMS